MAFDHSRRRWFGTCPCRPVPRGRPSSVKQLRATQSFLLSRSWRTVIGIADEINTRLSSGRLDSHLREPFSKELFKPVQCEISKRWGDNSTLRGSIHRFVKDVFLHVTRFQPFSKNGPVHWCTGQEPFVTDFVETTFDVTLEDPLRACVSQCVVALSHRICTGPALTEPIRVFVSGGFHNWIKCEQVQRLLGSIHHCGDDQRELHFTTASIGDGQRSFIPFTRCAVSASRY